MATQDTPIEALNKEYKAYISILRTKWCAENNTRSENVFEVMRPKDRAEVRRRIAKWADYMTPLAEAWWRNRGYGVVWPEDSSEPIQIYKLNA